MASSCVIRLLPSGMDDRLSAAQREYDGLEEMLLRRHPALRLYLYEEKANRRAAHEQQLLADPEFRRWQALAVEITRLVLQKG